MTISTLFMCVQNGVSFLVVVCVQGTFVSGTEHTFLSGSIIIAHGAHTYFLVLLQPLHRPSPFLARIQCVHLLLVLLYCTVW